MFLSAATNADFVRAISQRSSIYNPDINIGQTDEKWSVKDYAGGISPTNKKVRGKGKFNVMNLQREIAEIRIFQSTTNVNSFIKNLEFTWALWLWTKPETASGNSWDYRDFVKWLMLPANKKQFPTLVKYISKEEFIITSYRGNLVIQNSWKHLIPALKSNPRLDSQVTSDVNYLSEV